MKTNMTPEMWESHLETNADLIINQIKKGNLKVIPNINNVLNNPQYITERAAHALLTVQKGIKKPIPIFPLFSHLLPINTNKKLVDNLKAKTWGTWLQILAVKKEMELFQYVWDNSNPSPATITLYLNYELTDWGTLTPLDEYFLKNVAIDPYQDTDIEIRFWGTKDTFPKFDKKFEECGLLPHLKNGKMESVWDEVEYKNGVWLPQNKKMVAKLLLTDISILNKLK